MTPVVLVPRSVRAIDTSTGTSASNLYSGGVMVRVTAASAPEGRVPLISRSPVGMAVMGSCYLGWKVMVPSASKATSPGTSVNTRKPR